MKKVFFPSVFFLICSHNLFAQETVKDVSENHILYLNALNFDFDETQKSTYVGHFNIFAPSICGSHFGFNAGVMKLNYSNGDTVLEQNLVENIALDPLQTLHDGDSYLRQLSKYSTKLKKTDWSIYIQPLITLVSSTNGKQSADIYFHTHFELLVNRWNSTTTITSLEQDTAIFDTASHIVVRSGISNESTYKSTQLNGYFGLGFTFNLSPWENGSFFFQPTLGFTTDYPQYISNSPFSRPTKSEQKLHGFYLIRAYYTQKLSKDATVVLGTDIRGILPSYTPKYAVYLGINLKVESVLGLLGVETEKKTETKIKSSSTKDDSDE